MKTKKPKVTRANLERQLVDALAGQVHVYHFASIGVEKASIKHMLGSGVVLTLTALGGREIVSPTLIRNGLSDETIAAIQRDLKRSYDNAIEFKPKEPK